MSLLKVFLFGRVSVSHDHWAAETKMSRAVQSLLAYLLLNRHRYHPREVLLGLFWGDSTEERARSCLSTALWRLRTVLEPQGIPKGTYLLTTATGTVGFNQMADHWLDVAVFEDQVSRILAKPIQAMEADDVRKLEDAQKLYTGELLEGFYDDWALRERERLRLLNLKSLKHLMRYKSYHGAYEEAVNCGQQILALDPLIEEIHRDIMRLLVANGQRTLAIRQYQACCKLLEQELGILPMEETRAVFSQIMQGGGLERLEPTPDQHPESTETRTNLELGLQTLHRAMQSFEEVHKQLQHATNLLENLVRKHISGKARSNQLPGNRITK